MSVKNHDLTLNHPWANRSKSNDKCELNLRDKNQLSRIVIFDYPEWLDHTASNQQAYNFTQNGDSLAYVVAVTQKLTAAVRVLRAARADSRIGMASERSASHSSLMALAAIACPFATSSSANTTCWGKILEIFSFGYINVRYWFTRN